MYYIKYDISIFTYIHIYFLVISLDTHVKQSHLIVYITLKMQIEIHVVLNRSIDYITAMKYSCSTCTCNKLSL